MARITQFKKLSSPEQKVRWVQRVFEIIAKAAPNQGEYVADAETPAIKHTTNDINEIRNIQYESVKASRVADGQSLQTIGECVEGWRKHFVTDGIWNPMSGIGSIDDPGMYSYAYTPVSMSPQECTAYYASGGLPKVIVDKKSKGILLNGYQFKGEGWDPGDLKRMHDYADLIGFGEAMSNGTRDGLCYGGAILYPRLKKDNTATMPMSVDELLQAGVLTQNSIDHFVTADRWNCVLVPNWNVTARDYLHPETYYIPIGGVEVATERSGIIRPNMLPYWGMLPQMGWGVSDYEGYISPILGYTIIVMSIPIMAQQMSLLFHEIPLDGVVAMSGADKNGPVARLIDANSAAMRSWSIIHPQAINSFGEVKAIERHYEGFKDLVVVMQEDIGARSEMPVSTLFMSNPQGLASDRGDDIGMKESGAIKKVGASVEPQLKPVCRMIAYSCFGPDYFQGAKAALLETIGVSFDSPTIQTPEDKADSGDKFAGMVQKLVASDIPVDIALEMSKQFFPGVVIDDSLMARLRIPAAGASAPDGYGGAAELEGVMEKGQLIEQLLRPGAYLGTAGGMN
jgi:hypothetical protein